MNGDRTRNVGGRPKGSRTRVRPVPSEHLRVVSYARTDRGDRYLPIDKQESATAAYCAARGFVLVSLQSDAVVGGDTMDRAGVSAALSMIRSGEANALLVYSIDRLTTNVVHLSAMLDDDFLTGGARLLAVHGDVDAHTASGRMSLRMMTLVAQYHRESADEP